MLLDWINWVLERKSSLFHLPLQPIQQTIVCKLVAGSTSLSMRETHKFANLLIHHKCQVVFGDTSCLQSSLSYAQVPSEIESLIRLYHVIAEKVFHLRG